MAHRSNLTMQIFNTRGTGSFRRCLIVALLLLGVRQVSTTQLPASGYLPQRVYDSEHKRFVDFEAMSADLARADVVFIGERHDDPATHRLELAVLEGLIRRRSSVVVALEMFERDVQPALDAYLAGSTTEEEFLKVSRPWPRYATDYRPLVEFAKVHRWPVVAGNVPRRLAANVASKGRSILDALPPDERLLAASDLRCPIDDDYFDRFAAEMADHPGATGGQPSASKDEERKAMERFYFSQCLKDETMAESVAGAVLARHGGETALVVHYNGAFHTDFGGGTAARTRRRLPGKRIVVVSVLPVETLDSLKPDKQDRKRADYLIFTLKPAPGRERDAG